MSGRPLRERGALAPNAMLRVLVVPQGPSKEELIGEAALADGQAEHAQAGPGCIGWARLLERVFDIDMQHCPECGRGEMKIIAVILERPVIEKIL